MIFNGTLSKMESTLETEVRYTLVGDSQRIAINDFIGQKLRFSYQGKIICVGCGKETPKSFFQGYCYPCFSSSPETAECILRPELCRAHEGIGRDMDWERKHHIQDHYVYLAISSGLKVGITRTTQVPTRWIDQGASEAIIFAKTPNRYLCGVIEVFLKDYVSDKTSWQRMLKNDVLEADLRAKKNEFIKLLPENLKPYISDDNDITTINYPVLEYPEKVKSVTFDKVQEFEGVLKGIKGQYLLFDEGRVFNVRRHTGYLTLISL